ncbi:uracil-DNA glycosylase [Vagococcus hydrophili]|uniref:Uracil-DNA glycosylase n=1 Tax=Vagococcus hydrophili TaxID=2714947 RepID=A0A6G8AT53_9ENTE|nr:uracil-DNA glycosylase [Vagococcus hydrophili]QIL48258.1 uracil-DNA glycosylase [Vagococcus hydrophili]
MTLKLPNDWNNLLEKEIKKNYFTDLTNFLDEEYQTQKIFPEKSTIFTAFEATSFKNVQVVILGQDPYHGDNQAHGLSFSVLPGEKIPPSLRNMYKELESDLGISMPTTGFLLPWATQGVFLLNTVLTVRKGAANSHQGKGWEIFTDAVITELNKREDPIIFVLWGKPASQKKKMIDPSKHFIIEAPHPSPLSAYRGFFGSKPYSSINQLLKDQNKTPIDWQLGDSLF